MHILAHTKGGGETPPQIVCTHQHKNHHPFNIHFLTKWGWYLINCVSKSSYPRVSMCSSAGQLSRRWEARGGGDWEPNRPREEEGSNGWLDGWLGEGTALLLFPALMTALTLPPHTPNRPACARTLDHELRKAPVYFLHSCDFRRYEWLLVIENKDTVHCYISSTLSKAASRTPVPFSYCFVSQN